MAPGVRAFLLSVVLLTIGLAAVFVEVETLRSGERIRQILLETDERRERVRRAETAVRRALSPDLLVREVEEEFEAREAEERGRLRALETSTDEGGDAVGDPPREGRPVASLGDERPAPGRGDRRRRRWKLQP